MMDSTMQVYVAVAVAVAGFFAWLLQPIAQTPTVRRATVPLNPDAHVKVDWAQVTFFFPFRPSVLFAFPFNPHIIAQCYTPRLTGDGADVTHRLLTCAPPL